MDNELRDNPRFYSDFYRDGFRKMVRWILVEVFIILGLLFAITYLVFFQPPSSYYVTTTGGTILPLSGGKVSMSSS